MEKLKVHNHSYSKIILFLAAYKKRSSGGVHLSEFTVTSRVQIPDTG